jgi:hypothetical protein
VWFIQRVVRDREGGVARTVCGEGQRESEREKQISTCLSSAAAPVPDTAVTAPPRCSSSLPHFTDCRLHSTHGASSKTAGGSGVDFGPDDPGRTAVSGASHSLFVWRGTAEFCLYVEDTQLWCVWLRVVTHWLGLLLFCVLLLYR